MMGNSEGKVLLWKPRPRREYNIKMDLTRI